MTEQRDGTALKLPERLRPPCPRGCVDVEGCGCDWNVEREAWPNGSALKLLRESGGDFLMAVGRGTATDPDEIVDVQIAATGATAAALVHEVEAWHRFYTGEDTR